MILVVKPTAACQKFPEVLKFVYKFLWISRVIITKMRTHYDEENIFIVLKNRLFKILDKLKNT